MKTAPIVVKAMNNRIARLGTLFIAVTLTGGLQAGAQLLTFDTIDATAGPVVGAPVESYFNSFGITVSSVFPLVVIDKNQIYSGNIVVPSSPPNILTLGGPNGTKSFTLEFSVPATRVRFHRAGIDNTIASMPEWQAVAYDSGGNRLSLIGEEARTVGEYGQPQFDLTGAAIKSVTWTSTTGGAAFSAVLLDDLEITPVPEPRAVARLTSIGLGVAAAARHGSRGSRRAAAVAP